MENQWKTYQKRTRMWSSSMSSDRRWKSKYHSARLNSSHFALHLAWYILAHNLYLSAHLCFFPGETRPICLHHTVSIPVPYQHQAETLHHWEKNGGGEEVANGRELSLRIAWDLDHWWSLMIIDHSPTNHLKVIESLFVWRGAKKPSPAMSNRLWIFRMPSWDTGAELVWPSAAVYL